MFPFYGHRTSVVGYSLRGQFVSPWNQYMTLMRSSVARLSFHSRQI